MENGNVNSDEQIITEQQTAPNEPQVSEPQAPVQNDGQPAAPVKDNRNWAITAFVTAMIPAVLWFWHYCRPAENIYTVGTLVLTIYSFTLGLPVFVLFVIAAIKGMKSSLRKLTIASIIIRILAFAIALTQTPSWH